MKTRTYRNRISSKKKTRKWAKTRGGKVIGSGGYGCVFRPALKCKGAAGRTPKTVSKLMTKQHTANEYEEISKFLPILQNIPNYQDYFIAEGATICEPLPLTRADLESFDTKCKVLKKHGFTKETINDSLHELDSLNLPDGGIELGDYIHSIFSPYKYHELNKSLLRLLVNGIEPMNHYGLYHADIKESNVLVDTVTQKVRLIDWGLSAKTTGSSIPHIMYGKPLQYNLPFSCILLNDTFKTMYAELFDTYDEPDKDPKLMRDFLNEYIEIWNKKRGPGHLNLITSVWSIIMGTSNLNVIKKLIVPYLAKILMRYTRDGKFLMTDYFREVYLKNVDIWGFIICYAPFLENRMGDSERINFDYDALIQIFYLYLYKMPTDPIVIPSLVSDLKKVFLIK